MEADIQMLSSRSVALNDKALYLNNYGERLGAPEDLDWEANRINLLYPVKDIEGC